MLALSALIIDDERRGRELLQQLLTIHCPHVTTIVTAASLNEAREQLGTFCPDLLFLDIRLGDEYGLDIISFLPSPTPHIIITTAHQEFAIKAIKAKVLDYLLKPIIGDELKAAVQKAVSLQHNDPLPSRTLFQQATAKKVSVPTAEGFTFVNATDILYCKADGAYTHIYLKSSNSVLASSNLGELERQLPEHLGFFRAHHAWLINIHETEKYVKNTGGFVIMSDQREIPISQRKKTQFLEFIKRFS